jgi:uncharacterized protein YndB with AHSA1/START domain
MDDAGGLELRIERTFDAPAQEIFDAWTSGEVMRRWLHGGAELETPVAEVDLRVGGRLRVVMRNSRDGTEHGASGEYTVVDPPNRLAFTWVWDRDPNHPLLVELTFTEHDGRTTVVLVNRGLADEEQRDDHERGWNICLDNLEPVLAR